MKPLVSIVTVNYNGLEHTLDLIKALSQNDYPNFELWVVDNASQESVDALEGVYDWVHLIRSEENLGFAGGNNLAIRKAKGKYIYLLNNDTIPEPDCITPLVDLMEAQTEIGIVASKLRYTHHPEILQFAGSTPMHPIFIRSHSIGFREKDEGQYDQTRPTALAHGAAMMVSAKAIQAAGYMPELYFLYYEEVDWCEMIKRAGFEIYFEPRSLVFHKESMTNVKNSPLQIYYKTRNRILFARRNQGFSQKLISMPYLFGVAGGIHLVKWLLKGRVDLVKAHLRALLWHVNHGSKS
jgi:GT2 family glycosyltransferase